MIERDYIMRMVHMLAAVLAKILFRKQQYEYPQAMEEIAVASQKMLGMDLELLLSLSEDELPKLLGFPGQHDRLIVAAELLREASEILELQGENEASLRQGAKAFSFFVDLVQRDKSYLALMSADKFSTLLRRLEQFPLTPALRARRQAYHALVSAAKDVLDKGTSSPRR